MSKNKRFRQQQREQEINHLLSIIEMSDLTLLNYLKTTLTKYYPESNVISDDYYYVYAKGDNPLCLVAHMDTVRGDNAKIDLQVKNKNVIFNSQGILGADDRAGVFGILTILERVKDKSIPLPSIIFTNEEESGGLGVKEVISDNILDTERINLFVEIDRQGTNEYVYYSNSLPKQVKKYINFFGFIEEQGLYSDIADLTEKYLIPSVNLSAGYYRQHTSGERLIIDSLYLTLNRVIRMLFNPIRKCYCLTAREANSWGYKWKDYNTYYPKSYSTSTTSKAKIDKKDLTDFLSFYTEYSMCPTCGQLWQDCDCNEIFFNMIDYFSLTDLMVIEAEMRASHIKNLLYEYLYKEQIGSIEGKEEEEVNMGG